MKVTFILLSILAATGTWWWITRSGPRSGPRSLPQTLRILGKSLAGGILVYFGLLLAALLYMMASSP